MTGYTRFVTPLLFLFTLASAAHRVIFLRPNSTSLLCQFVSGYTSPTLFLSQHQEPFIQAEIKSTIKRFKGLRNIYVREEMTFPSLVWDVDVIFVSKPDLQLANIDTGTELGKFNLDEVLAGNINQSAIMSFKLTPENNVTGRYSVPSTGEYCALMTLNLNTKVDDAYMITVFDYRQSHGELEGEDHKHMYIYVFSSFVYFVGSALYFYYAFLGRENTANDRPAIGEKRTQQQNGEIRLRIMVYLLGSSLVYLSSACHLYLLNRDGYLNISFKGDLLEFATLSLSTLFFCWALYNLLLMSSGYLLMSGSEGQHLSWFMKLMVITTFIGGLILDYRSLSRERNFHPEFSDTLGEFLVLEYFVCFVFGTYLSVKTFCALHLQGRDATANKFMAAVIIAFYQLGLMKSAMR